MNNSRDSLFTERVQKNLDNNLRIDGSTINSTSTEEKEQHDDDAQERVTIVVLDKDANRVKETLEIIPNNISKSSLNKVSGSSSKQD